ncbi:MAG: Bifunctional uridylyltransferase/uridylyl-removing enzyme [Alphaproteobacteria bacterium ADurb.BinA280]|jgi:[protein-PII] uridylyltransferase|nr:[protein-PII] uridylyltransferase [Xanthomonadales bacterium]MCC6505523.1 [protein-PII] uridylyltransferase [Aquimonas sp.]OPZ13542.1 MAG: Bifunctional uridylyltransferase/uridylyl-removing enzyme [Alphaproteobacteria bacterium ADurb.BinA280]
MIAAPQAVDTQLATCLLGIEDAAAWRSAVKRFLADAEQADALAFDAGTDIDQLLAARTRRVDAVLCDAFRRDFQAEPGLCLLATGGYGRGELFPYSDVDVLLLIESDQAQARERIEQFLTRLWDAGLAPGHAVRSLQECLQVGGQDATVATALLECRYLCGDADAALRLKRESRTEAFWPSADFFEVKLDEQRQRHARYNDTAYNLEPNLKEGPGGLRDLHSLTWMAKRIYGVNALNELIPLGAGGRDEIAALERERRALSRVRYGLHMVAQRREERLLFDYQRPLALRFGFEDQHADNLAVEQLMQGYFRSAAVVVRLNGRLLQRFQESLAGDVEQEPIDEDYLSAGGFLKFHDAELLRREPLNILTMFRVWAANPSLRGLHSTAARALGEALPSIDEAFRARPDVRRMFLAILRGNSPVASLERMWQLGVLGRYLPSFGNVSGRMQYDLFHVYTVDQHTLAVLKNIASFSQAESTQRFALAHALWPRLRKPELLLLAGLFHDIAKGRGGDHSKLGALDAEQFCLQHGLGVADADLVAWLVRQHLLMSVTAQRQDISDPSVIERFAAEVRERERLDYLYMLTVADIAGTSPKLWNAWKDRLLADLHGATRFTLRRGLENRVYADERIAETRAAAKVRLQDTGLTAEHVEALWVDFPPESFLRYSPEQIAWQTKGIASASECGLPVVLARPHSRPGALEIFVYSPDRDGLFAAAAATLDRLGLTIAEARIVTSPSGVTMDTFQVLDAGVEFVAPERRAATIAQTLRDALSREHLDMTAPQRMTPRQLKHFRIPVQIEFVPDLARARTTMTLVCTDRPGLLASVAVQLRSLGLRIHDARIATFGERVEDFFQISDEADHAVIDPQRLQELRERLVTALSDTLLAENKGTPHVINL